MSDRMKLLKLPFLSLLMIVVVSSSCDNNKTEQDPQLNYVDVSIDVIPKPLSVKKAEGSFTVDRNTSVVFDESLKNSAEFLELYLHKGVVMLSSSVDPKLVGSQIRFSVNDSIVEEGYKIEISAKELLIEAKDDKGAFFVVQTSRQLLPASFENSTDRKDSVNFDLLKIEDSPKFAYRGFMLDVARHFFTVGEVKRTIDLLAIYKINTLHMHLSDDQGWRIEIKSWPNLTAHGSKSSVGNKKGGFYTQEDYKEIQDYASKHHIVIIPEIDLPGHTNAVLSSYAVLNCNNKATKLYKGMKVGFSSLCVRKDITYKFIDDVIGELADITTGDYIHIGGDESHSTKKDDYIYFIDKAIAVVKSHGKKVIGWDEIAHSEIGEETVVQFWSKEDNASLAVKKGAKVLLSPSTHIYLDIKYNDSTEIGLVWAGLNSVEDAYTWDVDTLIAGVSVKNIIGIEAPLWTETVVTMDQLEYLVFPRLPGVAELAWSNANGRSWAEYRKRLAKQKNRFEALGVKYYKSDLVDWE